MEKKIKEKDLLDSFYQLPKISKFFWPLGLILFFLLGFLYNFPIKQILVQKINQAIKGNIKCNLSYPDPIISFFPLPKVSFQKIKVPAECTNTYQDLIFQNLNVSFWGPGIYPFGLKLYSETKLLNSTLSFNLVFTLNQLVFQMKENNIDLKDAITILNNIPKMTGNISLSALIKTSYHGQIEFIESKINSSNINIPQQNFSNIDLPMIPLKDFNLDIQQTTKTAIHINDIKLGQSESPLFGQFSGKVLLNQQAVDHSSLDLTGQIRFTDEFIQKLPILKLLLKKYANVDGNYKMKIGGTLGIPIPTPIK